jgi:2-polyprenyl-6-methoxyphenol hydroxylase-like FAD-dependent oxidoreductase
VIDSPAVVCGASMSGLLTARVLADVCSSVTVIERDKLPEGPVQRTGVPQGRHLHQLLSSGLKAVEELFPGMLSELAAGGAPVFDGRDPSLAYLKINGHTLSQHGMLRDPDAVVVGLASRPYLESAVRERIRALPNVEFLDGHDVIEPMMQKRRVTGVNVRDRNTGRFSALPAALVVDATGRSARAPAFLTEHGYSRPAEQSYPVGLTYVSQLFRVPAAAMREKVALISPTLACPSGAGLLAYEDDTAMLTLIGVAGRRPPTDLPSILNTASECLPAHISAVLDSAEPLGGPTQQHYPVSVWRRYDKLAAFPEGLLVAGDAVCSLNPLYGQGMTSAALQARALRRVLARAHTHDLSQAYFRSAAKAIAPIWQANRLNDFAVTPTTGLPTWPQRALNGYTTAYMAAASTDITLTEAFLRVLQGVAPGTTLMHPARIIKVAKSARQRARAT